MMKLKSQLTGFKAFVMRGNVLDLAVGVIIGGAFGKIVTSLVNDVIMPVIGLIIGQIDFSNLKIVFKAASGDLAELSLKYGSFIQNIVDFLIIALCIYIFIKLIEKFRCKQEKPAEVVIVPTKTEELLAEIRDLLKDKKGI